MFCSSMLPLLITRNPPYFTLSHDVIIPVLFLILRLTQTGGGGGVGKKKKGKASDLCNRTAHDLFFMSAGVTNMVLRGWPGGAQPLLQVGRDENEMEEAV